MFPKNADLEIPQNFVLHPYREIAEMS